MIHLEVTPDLDAQPWEDLRKTAAAQGELYNLTRIGRLPRGTKSGASTVIFCLTDSKGKHFLGQTTMALVLSVARIFNTREATSTPRQPHTQDTKHSEVVGGNPQLRFRLTPIVTKLGPTAYIKAIPAVQADSLESIAPLDPRFTADDLRNIADDMDRRAARA